MIRLVIIFLLIGLFAVGAAWLADHPGEVVLTWDNYRLETSLMAGGLVLIVTVGILLMVWQLLRLVFESPGAVKGFFRSRRRARGYHALSRGMIAVGTGDAKLAARYAQQARKILEDEPLTLLLTAQTAQLKGDQDTARRTFEAMLDSSETETLGLRGLFIEAQRRNDTMAARSFAERALKISPATPWAAEALFEMQCAAADWAGALQTLARNQASRLTDKAQAQRQRAVLLTAQALQCDRAQTEKALALALEAHQLAPDLVPPAVIAGRLLSQAGNVRKAMKVVEKTWRRSAHPDLAEVYADVRPGDTARDRLKRMRQLATNAPDRREAALALAAAAIDARDWAAARAALAPYLEEGLSQRVCSLMAEIEEAEHGDTGRVREWLARAVHAPRDPMWIADGVASPVWAPVSPVTGRLDAFEWRTPPQTAPLALSDHSDDPAAALPSRAEMDEELRVLEQVATRAADDAKPGASAKSGVEPVTVPAAAQRSDQKPAPAPAKEQPKKMEQDVPVAKPAPSVQPASSPPPATPDGAAASAPVAPPASLASNGMAASGPASGEEATLFPLRAPDDPGPGGVLGEDDEVDLKKR